MKGQRILQQKDKQSADTKQKKETSAGKTPVGKPSVAENSKKTVGEQLQSLRNHFSAAGRRLQDAWKWLQMVVKDRQEKNSQNLQKKGKNPSQKAPTPKEPIKKEAPKQGAPKQEAPKPEAPKQETPKQEASNKSDSPQKRAGVQKVKTSLRGTKPIRKGSKTDGQNRPDSKKITKADPNETPQERAERLRRQRLRRQQALQRKRRIFLLRILLVLFGVLLICLVIRLVGSQIQKRAAEKEKEQTVTVTPEAEAMETVDISNVLHLSFLSLIADSDAAFSQEDSQEAALLDQGRLTVEEFQQVLQQLYENGYVLVRLQDLVQETEDGSFEEAGLLLPAGKKPLILSQQNVNYDLKYAGQGIASRLALENGRIVSEYRQSDGTTATGDYDIVPCVETFVAAHPDFSYNGAKGILGLTGYNGILGYRTEDSLGVSQGNRYAAQYGTFDVEQEKADVMPVIEALKNSGWELACSGFGNISYASEPEKVREDVALWKQKVGSLTGETEILLYPFGTDISDWGAYDPKEEKYACLKEQGFRYFCALDISGSWTQMTAEYLRVNYRNLDGYRMRQELEGETGYFSGILDFKEIYSEKRPSLDTSEE